MGWKIKCTYQAEYLIVYTVCRKLPHKCWEEHVISAMITSHSKTLPQKQYKLLQGLVIWQAFKLDSLKARSVAPFSLSAVRRSARSDLSEAHHHQGLSRVQCAEVHKSSGLACMELETWGLMAAEMAGGLVEEEGGGAGVRGEGRQVSASSPVTPIR